MRTISTFCSILAATALVAFAADNSIGTWKLNVEKSKYTPGLIPIKSLTLTRAASDGGVKVTATGERADGTKINSSYTTKYDGKAATVTGEGLPYDSISVKQANANNFSDERKKTGGSYKATGRTVISNNSRTTTTTINGTNAEGKKFTSTLVFEKQ